MIENPKQIPSINLNITQFAFTNNLITQVRTLSGRNKPVHIAIGGLKTIQLGIRGPKIMTENPKLQPNSRFKSERYIVGLNK